MASAEIAGFLRNEVLKREVLEGERADAAEKLVRRANRKHHRVKTERPEPAAVPAAVAKLPELSSPVRTPAT